MLDTFMARLEACDPAKGHYRSYRLEAGTDLFGDWIVDIHFGRIGAHGRLQRRSVNSSQEAQKIVQRTLKHRATAKKRIGTSYRLIELHDPLNWTLQEKPRSADTILDNN